MAEVCSHLFRFDRVDCCKGFGVEVRGMVYYVVTGDAFEIAFEPVVFEKGFDEVGVAFSAAFPFLGEGRIDFKF